MSKNKEITIDELAMMVQKGFEGMTGETNGLKGEIGEVKQGIKLLDRGQEDIKLRLDNVPYRFEMKEQEDKLQKHDQRIGTLERKVFAVK